MEYGTLNLKKIHILRVDPGEDILTAVERFIAEISTELSARSARFSRK